MKSVFSRKILVKKIPDKTPIEPRKKRIWSWVRRSFIIQYLFFFINAVESSCSHYSEEYGTYLIEIEECICLEYISPSAIELSTEKYDREKKYPDIPDESFDFCELTHEIETEEESE